jgi:hypothetical protein
MTDGREHTSQKWLTEPDEQKLFIDVFNQPSSQLKPTEVVFFLWNRELIPKDQIRRHLTALDSPFSYDVALTRLR